MQTQRSEINEEPAITPSRYDQHMRLLNERNIYVDSFSLSGVGVNL